MLPMSASSSGSRSNLPQRTVSLAPAQAATFNVIEEELRDVRRVHSQGEEEDLRMALSRTISRVEELSSMLKEAYKVQTDIQTELTLAKSNLQLALANNEMLEDALKREGHGHSKDVGWRRWSAKEQREREMMAGDSRRQSTDSLVSAAEFVPMSPASPNVSATEPRFFRFRFGNTTPNTLSPRIGSPNLTASAHVSHLASASLPSLVAPRDKDKELEDLAALLEQEKKKHRLALKDKEALEAELESLSQALFEEANKMVAVERMRLAETAEELKEAQAEKQALQSALKLVESQSRTNSRAGSVSRGGSVSPPLERPSYLQPYAPSPYAPSPYAPSPYAPSPYAPSPATGMQSHDAVPPSPIGLLHNAEAMTRAAAPPPLDLPQVGLAKTEAQSSPPEEEATPDTKSLSPPPPQPFEAPSSSSTGASSTPSPGQYVFSAARPMSYFDGEESPWADVRSSTPVTAAF